MWSSNVISVTGISVHFGRSIKLLLVLASTVILGFSRARNHRESRRQAEHLQRLQNVNNNLYIVLCSVSALVDRENDSSYSAKTITVHGCFAAEQPSHV
jgi:hypothetical protein